MGSKRRTRKQRFIYRSVSILRIVLMGFLRTIYATKHNGFQITTVQYVPSSKIISYFSKESLGYMYIHKCFYC